MTFSPKAKQALSTVAVAVGFCVIGLLQAYVFKLPPQAQAPVLTLLGTLAFVLRPFGTAEETEAKIEQKAHEKASVIVADVLDAQADSDASQGRP
jgi:hypothetical protein